MTKKDENQSSQAVDQFNNQLSKSHREQMSRLNEVAGIKKKLESLPKRRKNK